MRIAFLGDLALIGKYDAKRNDITCVIERFEKLIPIFQECDFVVANLESPLTDISKTKEYKTLALRTPKCNVEVLKKIGVNAVTVANNHTYDYGEDGLNDTIKTLNEAGICYCGVDDKPLVFTKDGISVQLGAFCCLTTNAWHFNVQGSNGRLNTLTREAVESFLDNARADGAYPVISVHWGQENTHYPNRDHVQFADEILAQSKCTLIGHHPHVLQGIKKYENGIAAFSLGNFCFDDLVSDKSSLQVKQTEENRKSLIIVVDLKENGQVEYEYYPIVDQLDEINTDLQILQEIEQYSATLSHISDVERYESVRKEEQLQARETRLGKRDLKWVVSHMNKNAIMCVYQRKQNQKQYSEIRKAFYSREEEPVILYIGNFDRPDLSAAGKRVYGNALALRQLGYRVVLVGKSKKKEVRESNTVYYSENITYASFPEYGMCHFQKYIDWLERYLDMHRIRPNVIIRYGSPSLSLFHFVLKQFAKKYNASIVTDVVDWLSADSNSIMFNAIKNIDTWLEKGIFYKDSDAIVAISTYLGDYYRNCVNNVIVVPPLVAAYDEKVIFRNRMDKIQIVYAGSPFRKGAEVKNVHKIKDRLDLAVEFIAEALKKNAQIQFDIYGLRTEEYLTAFPKHQKIIEDTKSNIYFHGQVAMQFVQEKIREADYTILLRENNRATSAGFPTKVVESMSCGTPVITTKTSDLDQYIQDGINGLFVDINDPNSAIKTLVDISRDGREKGIQMKENCLKTQDFCYKRFVNIIEAMLQKL